MARCFKILPVVYFFQILIIKKALSQKECLGIAGACDLRLDEITLPGAHNAGSGFDGRLMYHNPYLVAVSCWYRNQYKSVTSMLNAGIRYFDLDVCYEDRGGYEKGTWTCHADAYGGTLSKFLKQMDDWLNDNEDAVVVLHFNRDHETGSKQKLIGQDIVNQLKGLWDPSGANGKLAMQTNINAKIGDSIKDNKRIYVFLHSNLKNNIHGQYLFHQDLIGYTWVSRTWITSNNCRKLATEISDNCPHEARRKFVRLDLYLTSGLCIWDLAKACNGHIKYATKRCYENIQNNQPTTAQTVNFITIDYATEGKGKNVVKVAKEMTERYIAEKKN